MRKNTEKGHQSYITPQDSLCIYGIAIFMMVWHHFFGFPERFEGNLQYIGGSIEYTIELYLGYFCRLCIAMYAFISGYGMMAKSVQNNLKFTDDIKLAIKQILKFFVRYWIVFIIFIPLGFKLGVLRFDLKEFIKNFVGRSCSYNAEWWYVAYYVKMLIIYPFIKLLLSKLSYINNSQPIVFASVILLGIINTVVNGTYTYYLCFLFGMIIYNNGFFDRLNSKWCGNYLVSIIASIGGIIFCIVARIIIPFDIDAFLVVIYIYACLQILKTMKNSRKITNVLQFFGQYSIYIWLTHTFFLYYYFQEQFIQLKYTLLIYIAVMIVCLAISIILNKIYKYSM